MARLRHLSLSTIYVVTSDYGAECDDQKAFSQFVAGLKKGDEVFVMAGGPQPAQAARAMAQAVKNKTGKYPVTAEARPFESNKTPKEKIFSLVNGRPIYNQKLKDFSTVSRRQWQSRIDRAIKSNLFKKIEINILSPIFSEDEFYNLSRISSDLRLAGSLKKLDKSVNIQMILEEKGGFGAYNYNKSRRGLPEKLLEYAKRTGCTTTFVDGNCAKDNAFKISARQPALPGVENSISFYIENLQVPWANMPGSTGAVPKPEQMHVTMFTPKGEYPCLFHMSGAYPHGFGRERLAKDICAILKESSEYKSFSSKIEDELNRFDTEVMVSVYGEKCDITAIKQSMHNAMLGALNTFAREKGVAGQFETFADFFEAVKELAEETKTDPVASPFTYIDDFTKILFRDNPWYKQITDRAQQLSVLEGNDGKSHVSKIAGIVKDYNAQAVSFDAVTIAAARNIAKDPSLAAYFKKEDKVYIINPERIAALKDADSDLYRQFIRGVREVMTQDGTSMAYSDRELGLLKRGNVVSAGNKIGRLSTLGSASNSVAVEAAASIAGQKRASDAVDSTEAADTRPSKLPRQDGALPPVNHRKFTRSDHGYGL